MNAWCRNTLVAAIACASMAAQAQTYPTKPIRLIVTFAPGGSSDTVARIISPRLSERLGQPVVIENRPGGGGSIGADSVAKAAPDGYTLVVGAQGGLALNTIFYPKLPYDPLKDFAPITLLVKSPFVVSVNPAVMPVGSVRELIALLKAQRGTPFASGGTGSGMHLSGELFKLMANLDMTHVPYKGNGPALTDLVGGQVPIAFTDLGSVPAFLKSGRIRALAVTSRQRSSLAPDIPSAAEAGLPDWVAFGWFGLAAPAGTPSAVIGRLNAETTAILRQSDVRERILATFNEPSPTTPEEFGDFIRAEISNWSKVIREAGVKVEQ
jgi:tripartite-type tricarboxylate transporter receptor subunit TctC